MMNSETMVAAIERFGMERAAQVLGNQNLAAELWRGEDWRAREALVALLMASQEAREAILDVQVPGEVINSLSDERDFYMIRAALVNAHFVDGLLARHEEPKNSQFLDFGCGTGRLLRFLTQFSPQRNYFGCDVVAPAVSYLQSSGMPGTYRTMSPNPPAPFADGQFDTILAWSIFTHYSEVAHFRWLFDLRRMLRPGGLLLATIHNDARASAHPGAEPSYRAHGFGFEPYPDYLHTGPQFDRENFGQTLISPEFVRRMWPSLGYTIEDIVTAVPEWQDMVVLRAC